MRDEALAAHEVRPSSSGARSSVVASEGRREELCGHLAAPIGGGTRLRAASSKESRDQSAQRPAAWQVAA